jgi:hypothetical protein
MSSILAGLDNQILLEQRTYKLWESAGHKIMEAQLTADQIKQLFANVEQGATAAGGNRTLIGKGKDAAGAVNKAWEDLKSKVYNSGPMNNFAAAYDKQAEKLKQATGGDQGVFKYVQKYRDFAEKHPIIQGFVYSALIAAAGVTGAGLGGAAVLGLFKLTDQLLQGKDIRSAIYQGAKTGALAYGASKLGDLIKGKGDADITSKTTSGSSNTEIPADVGAAMNQNDAIIKGAKTAAGDPVWVKTATGGYMDPAAAQQWATEQGYDNVTDALAAGRKSFSSAIGQATSGATDGASQFAINKAGRIAQELSSRAAADASEAIRDAIATGEIRPDMINVAKGVAQGALDKYLANGSLSPTEIERISRKAAMMIASKAGAMNESIDLNEATIKILFSKVSLEHSKRIDEGIMDTLKGAAGKAMDYAKTKGHNLTTKITADKLNTAWEKAGKPTDSDQIATILKSNGVPEDVVKNVFAQMKIPVAAAPAAGQQPAQGAAPAQPAAKPAAQQPAAAPQAAPAQQPAAQPTQQAAPAPAAKPAAQQPAASAPAQPAQKPGAVNKTPPKPNAPTAGTRSQKGAFAYNPLAEDAEKVAQLEAAMKQAQQITRAIKYDDSTTEIIVKIQDLAAKNGIDPKSVKYAISDVYEAKSALESAVYGLDELFKDAWQDAKWKHDDEEEGLVEEKPKTAKALIYQTDMYGAKGYYGQCKESGCDFKTKSYDRPQQAQAAIKKHHQEHFKQGVAEAMPMSSLTSRYVDDPKNPAFATKQPTNKDPLDSLEGIIALRKTDPMRAFRALQNYGFNNPRDPMISAASKKGSEVKQELLQKAGITDPRPWDITDEMQTAIQNAIFDYIEKNLKQGVAETHSTGTTIGSAGIGGGSGLGIDKSPIEKVLEKPFGIDEHINSPGGMGQSYRKFRPKSAGMDEDKIAGMNDPRSDGWRVYKAVPAGVKENLLNTYGDMLGLPKESAIMKGLQPNMNEYELDSTRKIEFSKDNPPDLGFLYHQFMNRMLSSTNTLDPKEWISKVNNKYGLNHTYRDYQNWAHSHDHTGGWDKFVKRYVLGK